MDIHGYFIRLYEYHDWANTCSMEAARKMSAEQLNQPQSHGWGSAFGILVHVYTAEWIWFQRLAGRPVSSLPRSDRFPDLDALAAAWEAQARERWAFLQTLDEGSLQEEMVYTNTAGHTYHIPVWQVLAHVANHATHHRAELAELYAAMGVEHGEDDWLHEYLQRSGQQ